MTAGWLSSCTSCPSVVGVNTGLGAFATVALYPLYTMSEENKKRKITTHIYPQSSALFPLLFCSILLSADAASTYPRWELLALLLSRISGSRLLWGCADCAFVMVVWYIVLLEDLAFEGWASRGTVVVSGLVDTVKLQYHNLKHSENVCASSTQLLFFTLE